MRARAAVRSRPVDVSHHLKTLAEAGIFETGRQGLFAYYLVRPKAGRPGRPARSHRTSRSPVTTAVTYKQVAELPVVIEEYALDVLSRCVSSGFRWFTTVFALAGGGHRGVGEDVTYEAAEHRLLHRGGAVLALAGTWTLEAFSWHLDRLDTFPDRPPAHHASGGRDRHPRERTRGREPARTREALNPRLAISQTVVYETPPRTSSVMAKFASKTHVRNQLPTSCVVPEF